MEKKLLEYKKIAKAYKEMGMLNLEIANESFYAENEGEMLSYEMATKNS